MLPIHIYSDEVVDDDGRCPLHDGIGLVLLLVLDDEGQIVDVFEYPLLFGIVFVPDVEDDAFELEESTSQTNHGQRDDFLFIFDEIDHLSNGAATSLDILSSLIPGGSSF